MQSRWFDCTAGIALFREEVRQVGAAFDSIFGDQFLQIGTWGDQAAFRRYARTRRYAVLSAEPGLGVDLVTRPEDLAVATDSIDAVFLPHVLEASAEPHAVLREVDRVLRPDGHLVITGFNAWGWWGARHLLTRRRFPAGCAHMLSEYRLRDWLHLLDYRVEPARFHHLSPPIYGAWGAAPLAAVDPSSDPGWPVEQPRYRRWHPLASAFVLVARKEVFSVTPIRWARRRQTRLVGSLVNPTTRNAA